LTTPNIKALKNEYIDFLIGQNPERQGFMAMKTLIEFLIYRNPIQVENYMPLDILTKETIDYYQEF
jgi:LacI family transcriptional regulator